ncbi:hypothetical protein KDH83_22570 [Achromobacter sp. Marseille-Q0513]|uniref:hypothetical protein n=1 Tax=Achromobacter sp. Marseille-Q0513 TaxID=2829161 RepID=UPI001BA0410F|nr:hypothetical protein [Achromobacter sp. Marseille-Q0513]MBR8656099.1 hypothetical protein [Achromobacter sp. Marseille-Q0513]
MKRGLFPGFASCAAMRRGLWVTLLAALWPCAGREAQAQRIYYADIIEGDYSQCRIQQSGNVIHITFSVRFRSANGYTAGERFYSRGLALFGYDETGKQVGLSGFFRATINGNNAGYTTYASNYLVEHAIRTYPKPEWMDAGAYTANVAIETTTDSFRQWPAIGMQVVNVTGSFNHVFPKIGAAYVGLGTRGCQLIDPTKPPPSPVTTEITVTAPDWDLGELERGKETTRTFATDAQRLCFRYDPKYIEYDKYLISASNRNGVAENKFLLANTVDGGGTIPYVLSLAGGGAPVPLPSIDGVLFTLGKSGRTCLTPTFKAWAGADIKGGDFSDVLTFTITTTP